MLDFLLQLDASVSRFLSSLVPSTPVTDWLFLFLSVEEDVLLLIFLGIVTAFLFRKHLTKPFIALILAAPAISFISTELILKPLFQRLRPFTTYPENSYLCPENFSFPSGHAALAMSSAVILAYFDPKRSLLYYSGALAVMYSRIYLLCHYMSDVIAGAIVGAGIGWLLIYSYLRLKNKKDPSIR